VLGVKCGGSSFEDGFEFFLDMRRVDHMREVGVVCDVFGVREKLFEHRERPRVRHRFGPSRRTAAFRKDKDGFFARKFVQPGKFVVDALLRNDANYTRAKRGIRNRDGERLFP